MFGQLTAAEIEDVLRTETIARLGCHADGKTYVVPITYAYDGVNLIGHSAEGRKVWMMRANAEVCVQIDRMYEANDWRGVICWGRYHELEGDEAKAALDMMVARFRPVRTSKSATPPRAVTTDVDVGRPKSVIYRIALSEKTGRFERR